MTTKLTLRPIAHTFQPPPMDSPRFGKDECFWCGCREVKHPDAAHAAQENGQRHVAQEVGIDPSNLPGNRRVAKL